MGVNNFTYMFISILIMTGITYLLRVVPLIIFRKKIENRFVKSFLYYVPYAVLSAMTFPAIFTCTGNVYASCAGTAVSIILAFTTENLVVCAVGASVIAYVFALTI